MKHNFSAGPSILPQEVFQEASNGILNFNNLELSVLEISHRSKDFVEVLDRSVELVKDLLNLPDTHKPLFLTGGASSQFFMAPMNLLHADQTAHYVDTGSWSTKAIKEAKLFGQVNVLASSKEDNFSYIPKEYDIPNEGAYLHLTSNNTIYGTQYAKFPETDLPIVCDMSSDIFSRSIEPENYGLIYAGAQKNMGPAGTTLVIVNEELLGQVDRDIPTMLDYRTHIKKNSAFNTPPVFPIYVSMLVMEWVQKNGGVAAMKKRNDAKSELMYGEIDRNPLFKGVAAKEDRSQMNATFVLNNPELAEAFLKACREADCVGLKGHRSVGGFRASMYNALPIDSVRVLVEVMQEFERTHG